MPGASRLGDQNGRTMSEPARFVVVVVDRVDEYQTRLLRGVRSVVEPRGLPLIVHGTDPFLPGVMPTFSRQLHDGAVLGAIVTSIKSEHTQRAITEQLAELGLPSVGIGVSLSGGRILGDNVSGMAALMAHLLDQRGVRRPALVRGLPHQPDSMEREAIFRRELLRRGMVVDESLVVEGEFNQDATYRAMRELLGARRDMDCVVALNDLSALGAMSALVDAGLIVPDDVVVTGFDNEQAGARTWPGLTTVDPRLEEQGRLAATQLLQAIEGNPVLGPTTVPARLVMRRSTASPDAGFDLDDTEAALDMARAANTEVATLDAVLELNRSMMTCASFEQVVRELTFRMDRLGLGRCFIAMYGMPGEEEPSALASSGADPELRHDTAHLVLAYRDGQVPPFERDAFESRFLLPPKLREELRHGMLIVQPLSVAERDLGYVLFEQRRILVTASEVLRMDLSRTLHAIATNEDLTNHAETLERLVARRTRQLETEVMTRRRAERYLQHANAELQRSLALDGLTRISNRGAFQQHLEHHWTMHVATGEELALLMVDVDLFKAYNDRYGHLLGDETLRTVAACLQQSVRDPEDLACRYGGEEFAVILPRTNSQGARAVAERFRFLLADAAIPHDASTVARTVTASIGVAVLRPTAGLDPVRLIDAADRALYRAKSLGRNRIAMAERFPQSES